MQKAAKFVAKYSTANKSKAVVPYDRIQATEKWVEYSLDIVAADMPHAGTLEFGVRAVVAQHEREEISKRTKQALQAAKARGVVLGCPTPEIGSAAGVLVIKANADSYCQRVGPIVRDILAITGARTIRDIAAALQARSVTTPRGNITWGTTQVSNLLKRLNLKETSLA